MMLSSLLTTPRKDRIHNAAALASAPKSTYSPMASNHLAPGLLLTNGMKFYQALDYVNALESLNKYLELVPANKKVKMTVLDINMHLRNYKDCLAQCESFLAMDQTNLEVLAIQATILSILLKEPTTIDRIALARRLITALTKIRSESRCFSEENMNQLEGTLEVLLVRGSSHTFSTFLIQQLTDMCSLPECTRNLQLQRTLLTVLARESEELLITFITTRLESCDQSKDWLELTESLIPSKMILLKLQLLKLLCYQSVENATLDTLDSSQALVEKLLETLTESGQSDKIDCDRREELLASVKYFQAKLLLTKLPYLSDLRGDASSLKLCLQTLSLSLSGSIVHDLRRNVLCISIFKNLVYCIDLNWIFGTSKNPLLKSSSGADSFRKCLFVDKKVLPIMELISPFLENLHQVNLMDSFDILYRGLTECCNSLKEIISFTDLVGPSNLRRYLQDLFPTLATHHQNAAITDGKIHISPSKNYKFDTSKTPTIADLESFLYFLILERQLHILDSNSALKSDSQFLYCIATSSWKPRESAVSFWHSVLFSYCPATARKPSGFSKIEASKIISSGLKEIRGTDKNSLGKAYNLLGLFYSQLDIDHSIEANVYSKFSQNESLNITSALFAESICDASISQSMDLECLDASLSLARNATIQPASSNTSTFDNHVGSTTNNDTPSKAVAVVEEKRAVFVPAKPSTMPGLFPSTPKPIQDNQQPSMFKDTPELYRSVPGYFPDKEPSTSTHEFDWSSVKNILNPFGAQVNFLLYDDKLTKVGKKGETIEIIGIVSRNEL